MSLCNVILQPSAGYLMSDAGTWDWDGRLIRLDTKVHLFPAARAAVVIRGAGGMEPDWWEGAGAAVKSLEMLFKYLPEWAAQLKEVNIAAADMPRSDVELTVVYWDGKPRARQLDTSAIGETAGDNFAAHLDQTGERRPGKFYALPDICLTPTLTWGPQLPNIDYLQDEGRFDVRAAAPAIVESQRATKGELGGKMIATVAGWVDMAVVTRQGVTLERVTSWPEDVAQALSVCEPPTCGSH